MTERPGVVPLDLVFGAPRPPDDDPAELFHEASKIRPSTAAHDARGVVALEASSALQTVSRRSVRRHPQRRLLELPAPSLPDASLTDLLRRRRSERRLAAGPLAAETVSAVLWAGYGVVAGDARTVPSGGALYPLELHVVAPSGIGGGGAPVCGRYDPQRHAVELLDEPSALAGIRAALVPSAFTLDASLVVVVAAVPWRTRFKYGQRGYRFVLLEAGHVAQNLLLAATACGLGSVVVGGFYDGILERALGLDGVDETALVAVAAGAVEPS